MKSINLFKLLGECINKEIEVLNKQLDYYNRLSEEEKYHIETGKKFNKLITEYPISQDELLDIDEVALDDPEYDWFAKLNLSPISIRKLIACAEENRIGILFTPVSVRTAEYIYEAGLRTVKIASSFINKMDLLSYINTNFKTVYVSTGMADLEEISALLEYLDRPKEIIILHCISEYPTGPLLEQRGLKALDEKDVHMNMLFIKWVTLISTFEESKDKPQSSQ